MPITRISVFAAFAAIAALVLNACGSEGGSNSSNDGDSKTLTIGFDYAGSGPLAAYDIPTLAGMKFAADEINKSDSPIKIEIVAADNKGDQATGLSIAQQQLSDGVKAFVMTTAPMNVAIGTTYAKAGAVISMGMVSPPTVRNAIGPRAFSLAEPNTNAQAAVMAQYACSQGYKSAYILESQDMEYLSRPGGYFLDAFNKGCGGHSAGSATFKIGQTDFGSQVTDVVNSKADVIFTPMFVPDSIAFLKRLRGADSNLPFLSMDGQDTPAFTQAGGSAVDGAVFSTAAFPTPGGPLAKFFADFKAATGREPESNEFEAVGRDNIYAFLQAAKNANYDLSPDALVEGFSEIKDLALVTGTASMNPSTNVASKPVAVVQIQNGKPALVTFDVPPYVPTVKD